MKANAAWLESHLRSKFLELNLEEFNKAQESTERRFLEQYELKRRKDEKVKQWLNNNTKTGSNTNKHKKQKDGKHKKGVSKKTGDTDKINKYKEEINKLKNGEVTENNNTGALVLQEMGGKKEKRGKDK